MPTVNIYYNDASNVSDLIVQKLKALVAKELTCGKLVISDKEVSVRIIQVTGTMIASIEVEIHAHAFDDRVRRQDDICNAIRTFIMESLPAVGDVRVWLVLSQLGHSW